MQVLFAASFMPSELAQSVPETTLGSLLKDVKLTLNPTVLSQVCPAEAWLLGSSWGSRLRLCSVCELLHFIL